jgi:hypothetical protein
LDGHSERTKRAMEARAPVLAIVLLGRQNSYQGNRSMNKSREKLIQARAYELWEKEGRPHGAHERHWHQAIQEMESADQKKPVRREAKASEIGGTKVSKSKPARKPKPTKPTNE